MITKADKVRALAAQQISTTEIAKRLGIRYQQAYNALHRSSAAEKATKRKIAVEAAAKEKNAAPQKPCLRSDQLIKAGFNRTARWLKDSAGDLVLDGKVLRGPAMYAFVSNNTVLYLGVATIGLAKRLNWYRRPGATQKMESRIKALLLEALAKVPKIDIYTVASPDFDWGGFSLNSAIGIRQSLIETFYIDWNIRCAG